MAFNLQELSVSVLISQILDHEQEVCSTTGKSHAVIPAFTFYRDRTGDEDEKQGKRGNNTSYFLTKSVFGCSFARQGYHPNVKY